MIQCDQIPQLIHCELNNVFGSWSNSLSPECRSVDSWIQKLEANIQKLPSSYSEAMGFRPWHVSTLHILVVIRNKKWFQYILQWISCNYGLWWLIICLEVYEMVFYYSFNDNHCHCTNISPFICDLFHVASFIFFRYHLSDQSFKLI